MNVDAKNNAQLHHKDQRPADRRPDLVRSYFTEEWKPLLWVTVTGLVYNVGLADLPRLEGELARTLYDILEGRSGPSAMALMAALYLAATLAVMGARYLKRFYVRRFANNVNRRMKGILYGKLVRLNRSALLAEGVGSLMTKAVSDVDDCAEGMRKFTTEVFDTGVAMISYVAMLFVYDPRLTLMVLPFPLLAVFIADGLKKPVTSSTAARKESAGALNRAAVDRMEGALLYRVTGSEEAMDRRFSALLSRHERRAVRSGVLENAVPPIYYAVSMAGVALIVYFGARNVRGMGTAAWDIGAFTVFISCFTKLAGKTGKAAKLFNAVQRASASWTRIRPLLARGAAEEGCGDEAPQGAAGDTVTGSEPPAPGAEEAGTTGSDESPAPGAEEAGITGSDEAGAGTLGAAPREEDRDPAAGECGEPAGPREADGSEAERGAAPGSLRVENLSVWAPGAHRPLLEGLSFSAAPGQLVAVTGAVASGKSILGKAFLLESPYTGRILLGGKELSGLTAAERRSLLAYMGHEPELLSDTIRENILLGDGEDPLPYLQAVCMDEEVAQMERGADTFVGAGGLRLSGGQQERLALARTLAHRKPLMVLDDPFASLDKDTAAAVYANVRRLCADGVILLFTHRTELLADADVLLHLEDGRGTVTEGGLRS